MTTPQGIDTVDIAASQPEPPIPRVGAADTDVEDAGAAEVVLSQERLTARKEWTVSGAVRFRRRIVAYTRTIEVTVRREELEVEFRDIAERDGAWVGTDYQGPAVPRPAAVNGPAVFTLQEEVPDVTLRAVPYERVAVDISRVTRQVQLTDTARREQSMISGDTGASIPPSRI